MDWVRGRPPDALLFLKALVKTASQSLSSCSDGVSLPRCRAPAAPSPLSQQQQQQQHTRPHHHDRDRRYRHDFLAASTSSAWSSHAPADGDASEQSRQSPAGAVARRLAEGVLLGPLGEVGTLAGAVRKRVGEGLRERAAVR